MTLQSYLPQDRVRAIAGGGDLPARSRGSVPFADMAGFTSRTESLREAQGSRLGAEALSLRLGQMCSALIAEVGGGPAA